MCVYVCVGEGETPKWFWSCFALPTLPEGAKRNGLLLELHN